MNGTWMQRIAQYWLVLHLTGSGLALGLTAAFQALPVLLFGVWGGLVADRIDKRRLLVATQSILGGLGLLLGWLTLSGVVEVWMVFAIAACLGTVQAIDSPSRQSFLVEMVGPEHLSNAIGLNSSVVTSSRLIGPAIAGVVIAVVGSGWCFLYNGMSFFAVVVALLLMRTSELNRGSPVTSAPGQIREGLRYVWTTPELRVPLLVLLVIGMFAWNWDVILPLLARYTFHSGPASYGLMMSLIGSGSFVGAVYAAFRGRPDHRLFAAAALCLSVLILTIAIAPSLGIVLGLLAPMGTAMFICNTIGNNILQTYSSNAFRGRVMSFWVIAFLGTTPISAPTLGWVAQHFGPRAAIALSGGVLFIVVAVAFHALSSIAREVAPLPRSALPGGLSGAPDDPDAHSVIGIANPLEGSR